jgi:hypothetical protein
MIPKVNTQYNCFDDGKISEGRLYTVDVKEVIPFIEIGEKDLEKWQEAVKRYHWLFSEKTDYFIKTENGEDGDALFVRTKDGGWFSTGDFMNSGRLDVDGTLTASINKR